MIGIIITQGTVSLHVKCGKLRKQRRANGFSLDVTMGTVHL